MMDVEDIKNLLTYFVKGVYKANNDSKEVSRFHSFVTNLFFVVSVYSHITVCPPNLRTSACF